MHFSIPDTTELKEESGSSSYTGFNIHINGLYQCTVRFRQLHNLNEQLKRIHDPSNVPAFPPKKFLPLTSNQLEERRCQLEKYIQGVGQTPHLANTDVFTGFLLSAQLESSGEKNREISMDAFRMDGHRITVTCNINESSSQVLEKICRKINLPISYMYYFALFLVCRDDSGVITIVRKLQDFESPYISQKTIKVTTRLVIRKSYWDPAFDYDLVGDRVALDLIYKQTVSDLEHGWILCSTDTLSQLAMLEARESKREYLEIARNLKYYGYTQFQPCTCNYPEQGTACVVSAGYKELCLRVTLVGGDTREGAFKVTRMKCWRITIHNDTGESSEGERREGEPSLELSFEYLMAKEQLQWIRILSDQAILMSVCLQSMVDELLLKKVGAKIKQPTVQAKYASYNYMKRDGSNHQISISQSSSFDCLTSPTVKTLCPSTAWKWELLEQIDLSSPRDIVLQKIKKVDQEISKAEASIMKLKKKEQELTKSACQTAENSEEDSLSQQFNQLSVFQKICEENRSKALKSRMEMEKFGPEWQFPLYNQPSDTTVYHENIRKHALFKERLIKSLYIKKKKRQQREENLVQRYSKLMKEWHAEVEKIENSAERKNTLAKCREIFEEEFPELRVKREKEVSISQRLKNGAEGSEAMCELQKQKLEIERMRSRAVIPPLLLDAKEGRSGYIDNNGKIEDFAAEYKNRELLNLWTNEEKELFKAKFLQRPKDFLFVASYLKNKSVMDCVKYYYHSKKKENYKLLMRNTRQRAKPHLNCFGIVNAREVEAANEIREMILYSGPGVTTRHQKKQLKVLENSLSSDETMFKPLELLCNTVEIRNNNVLSLSVTLSTSTAGVRSSKPDRRKKKEDNGPNGG